MTANGATGTVDDSFYLGQAKAGVILRMLATDGLRTISCFALPDGSLFHARSEIRFNGEFTKWTSYRYEDLGAGTDVQVSRDNLPEASRDAVPSYGEFLLATGLATGESLQYLRLLDADPGDQPQTAVLTDTGTASVETPNGVSATCRQLVLTVEGKVQNTLWISGGAVLKSDWGGAESFLEPSREQALAGAPAAVVAAVG